MIRDFLKLESAGGILLFLCAVAALIIDNSSFSHFYQNLLTTPLQIKVGRYFFTKPILFWINEGLMSFFFLLVGLELKREFLQGALAGFSKILLPGFAALGGMLVPACIFIAINFHQATLKGWATPVATDIAFTLGVLSLFSKRIPLSLKLFVMSLAIFDDVGAIIIIAISYAHDLSYVSLMYAGAAILVLYVLNYFKVQQLPWYLFVGFILWLCVLKSGVHATVAGVLLAFIIPLNEKNNSPAHRLEKKLHPWVVFGVMPLFAFANAGVSFAGLHAGDIFSHLSLGIILGLVIGKQLGVLSFTAMAIRFGFAKLPENSDWWQVYGAAILCGIGFTMSLFLGTLAFEHDNSIYLNQVRLSVLLGSTLSGMMGAFVLHYALRRRGKQA